jgi:hypothetical protein
MTKKERITAALNHEKPDRTPLFDIITNTELVERTTGAVLIEQNSDLLVSETTAKLLDGTRFIMPYKLPGTKEIRSNGFVKEYNYWTSWVKERPFKDEDQAVAFMESEIEKLKQDVYDKKYIKSFREGYMKTTEHTGDTLFVATAIYDGLFDIYEVIGLDLFSFIMFDHPDVIKRYIDVFFEKEVERLYAEADPDLCPMGFIYSDIAYKDRLIFPLSFLEETGYFDRIRILCNGFHESGIKVIYHSDGNIMSILKRLKGCGIDAINPIETAAGMDVSLIADEFGDSLSIVGGIDCSQLLPFGSEKEIREAVEWLIKTAGRRGGLLLGSSTELHDSIPAASIMTMMQAAWEYKL